MSVLENSHDPLCSGLEEMRRRIQEALPSDGYVDVLPGVRLHRNSRLTEEVYGEAKAAFCVVAQGAKEIFLGGKSFRYDTHHYLLATVDMPLTSILLAPAEDKPFLSLRFEFEPAMVNEVMMQAGLVPASSSSGSEAMGVSRLTPELLDATVRIMRLLDQPRDAKMLHPLIQREVIYRLLQGEQGSRLRQLASPNSHTTRIAHALERLRSEFNQPLRIDSLAQEMGMSSTRFHHHFKAITNMSPLQFQKHLRLQEARRLMLSEELGAASAGSRVGYDDASHFSRDYKRQFGRSPLQDIDRLKTR